MAELLAARGDAAAWLAPVLASHISSQRWRLLISTVHPAWHSSAPTHCTALQKKEELEDGSTSKQVEERSEQYASWADATSCSLAGASIKRLTKLYLVLRGAWLEQWA